MIKIEVSINQIEAAIADFEKDNPGSRASDMSAAEFSRRMMHKIFDDGKIVLNDNEREETRAK